MERHPFGFLGAGRSNRWQLAKTVASVSLAFALLLVSIWTARNAAAGQPDSMVNFARLVKIAACFGLAWAFRSYIPPVRTVFWTGASLVGISMALHGIALLLPPAAPERLPLGYLAGLFSGTGEACLILVIAHFVAVFPPRISTVAVPVVYLMNEAMFLGLSYAPGSVLAWLRPALELLGIALAARCLARLRNRVPDGGVHPVQYGIDGPHDSSENVLRFLGGSREWVLLLVGTTLFPFIFGVVSQVVGAAQVLPGLYDPTTELCAIGLLCLLVGYGLWHGTRLSYDEVLVWTFPLFATGCLLLPVLWPFDTVAAGLLVKCGYTTYQVMFWMLLVRKAYEDPRHTYLYFGVFYGVFELATLLAREGVYVVLGTSAPSQQTLWTVGLVALWLIAMYGFAFFMLSRRLERSAVAAVGSGGSLSSQVAIADAEGLVSLQARIEAFCQTYALSPREREVLTEFVHGYSMEAIGRRLSISKDTVKTHVQRIYRKAGVSGKQGLVEFIDGFPLSTGASNSGL